MDELASTYRKTKQVTAQQCSAIAEKISKAALAFEQMCEDMKQFEEEVACDAHEVESEAAAKQIGLLQGMLQQVQPPSLFNWPLPVCRYRCCLHGMLCHGFYFYGFFHSLQQN